MRTPRGDLKGALEAHEADLSLPVQERRTLRALETTFGCNRQTLNNRITALTKPQSIAFQGLQAVTPAEEGQLVDYIIQCQTMGHPITPGEILEIANQIRINRLHLSPLNTHLIPPLSHNWIDRFRKQHPCMASRSLAVARFDGTKPEVLHPWFEEFKAMRERNNYRLEDMYDMDKTGYTAGVVQSTRVYVVMEEAVAGKGGREKTFKSTPGRQEWVTMIECISAAGKPIPPHEIFKGQGLFIARWMP